MTAENRRIPKAMPPCFALADSRGRLQFCPRSLEGLTYELRVDFEPVVLERRGPNDRQKTSFSGAYSCRCIIMATRMATKV